MTFAEKLKTARKKFGYSQEALAEKLNVSRQAITKWETEAGIPDIDNLMSIAALLNVSLDELLNKDELSKQQTDFLYESVTEYDFSEPKRCDIKLGSAKKVVISGCDGEKLRLRIASDELPSLQSDFKVKIDDVRRRMDVDVCRKNGMTAAKAKESVYFFIQLPNSYTGKADISFSADLTEVLNLDCEDLELDAKTRSVVLNGFNGTVEINSNLDMDIVCRSLNGSVEINQLSAVSKIELPSDAMFMAAAKGMGNSISYEKDGLPCPPFDCDKADNRIELNGMKSELIIRRG